MQNTIVKHIAQGGLNNNQKIEIITFAANKEITSLWLLYVQKNHSAPGGLKIIAL